MLSASSGSKSVHKTSLETNLVKDDYIRAILGELFAAFYGELLSNQLITVMVDYCDRKGIKAFHGSKKIITSKNYGSTRFNLLLTFEGSNLVLVACNNGVTLAYANMFDSL